MQLSPHYEFEGVAWGSLVGDLISRDRIRYLRYLLRPAISSENIVSMRQYFKRYKELYWVDYYATNAGGQSDTAELPKLRR